MVEGLEHDDGFRMVEDEFLATARQFTAHLHAAEYQRLKDVAASQNAETIRRISRPVVGSKSELVQRKHERAERRRKQKETRQRLWLHRAAKREHSDESSGTDEAGDLLRQNTSLYELMASPRKKAPRLDSVPGKTLGTRPAAASRAGDIGRNDAPLALSFETRPPGRPAAPVLDVDDDSDDLEAPGRHVDAGARSSFSGETVRSGRANSEKHAVSLPPPIAPNKTASTVAARQAHPGRTETFASSIKEAQAHQAHSAKAGTLNSGDTTPACKPPMATAEPAHPTDSESDDDPFGGIKSRLARRLGGNGKQQQTPRDAKKSASSSGDYMPSFL